MIKILLHVCLLMLFDFLAHRNVKSHKIKNTTGSIRRIWRHVSIPIKNYQLILSKQPRVFSFYNAAKL